MRYWRLRGVTGVLLIILLLVSQPTWGAASSDRLVLGYYAENYPGDRHALSSIWNYSRHMWGIATFTYLLERDGSLTGQVPVTAVRQARQNHLRTFLLIHNYRQGFDTRAAHSVLTNQYRRSKLVNSIVWLVRHYGYTGVNIDLEGIPAGDRWAFNAFLRELDKKISPYGLLTVSVPAKTWDDPGNAWSGAYDYQTIGRTADLVMIMSYDEHWIGGAPGPIASLPWVRKVVDYAVRTIPRNRLLLGIATYGYDWSSRGSRILSWREARDLVARYGWQRVVWDDHAACPRLVYWDRNGIRHEVWFENEYSLRFKLDLVHAYGLRGIAVWRLGFEDARFWQVVGEKL
ncbi:MAG: glycosyl hydrolase family 18 protein [Bacillota bacterium]|nr:glycosyl hydrolase family 18 protein [Bacillota bacterium]